jgi:pilus assembly protein CpaB
MNDESPRRRSIFLASVGVSLLGCALLVLHVKRLERDIAGGEHVSLLALRQDVSAGQPIAEDLLIPHDVPRRYVDAREVLAEDMPRILGVPVAIDLEANQTLAWTDLVNTSRRDSALAERIPRGMRAISIEPTSRHPLGGLLRAGDRVDVLLTRSAISRESKVTLPIVQNVLVLAVGDRMNATSAPEKARLAGLVTLLVTVEQAGFLAHARQDGELSLILRNQHDLEIDPRSQPTRDADLFQAKTGTQRMRRATLERVD